MRGTTLAMMGIENINLSVPDKIGFHMSVSNEGSRSDASFHRSHVFFTFFVSSSLTSTRLTSTRFDGGWDELLCLEPLLFFLCPFPKINKQIYH